MSKSFQQLLFFLMISIPLTAQGKNRFPGVCGKILHSAFYKNPMSSVYRYSQDSVEIQETLLPGTSRTKPALLLKPENSMLNLSKDMAIILLSSVLIVSFVRFRKTRKKQRSRLRQMLRNQHRLSAVHLSGPDEAAGYGFPNISIEESFGDDGESIRPKTESLMTSETENKLLELLDDFENGTLYNSKNMSLPFLAGTLNTNTKYLSFVINHYKSADFKTYINRLRIGYIVDKLSEDEKYRQYKISILAEECGFSSHSKFAAIFKAMTDYSPSAYIKLLDSGIQPDLRSFCIEEMSV
jgi:AraC-like DNA-binding protein